MSALTDLREYLQKNEVVEKIVFGPWGWGSRPDEEGNWEARYGEPKDSIPTNRRGVPLCMEEAAPLMGGWSFLGGFGAPDCYATYIWTNQRVIWVTQYDGATGLDSMPRHPQDCIPDMPGG